MHRHLVTLLSVGLAAGAALGAELAQKQPVYVGVRACATCHDGAGMGNQCSLWVRSKHARAYAVLAKPEAKTIVELSGIPREPQESPMCLGCHATGAHAEEWEKDEGFFVEDGVQCEQCHGPGSEYMDQSVMVNPEKAMAAGLQMPTESDCMVCHATKGSHVAVHNRPQIDIAKALQRVAHPTPSPWKYDLGPKLPEGDSGDHHPAYIGVFACAACHKGPMMGYQFSKWRMGPHARAFATLATEHAYEIAKEKGTGGSPQTSEACLKCHASAFFEPAGGQRDSYWVHEGVGCEACHGAGSEYAQEARMLDARAAHTAGLKDVTRQTCLSCHENAHDKPFDYEEAFAKIAHPTKLAQAAETPRYKTPLNLALTPDGRELYVTCEASHTAIVVDVASRAKVAEIEVGRHPTDVAFSPDGQRAFVSNRLDDTVSVVDVVSRTQIATIPVGDEPHGVLTDRSGAFLYVLNTSGDSISIIDTATLRETKRLAASRSPWSLSLAPDGSDIYVTNNLSRFVPFREPSMSEVTVIDAARRVVTERRVVPAANLMQGVAWHPSGKFALITLNRTKNLVPMTRLMQGWTITNGLGVVWQDGQVDQVLLDEPNTSFPDPADVAVTPDGKWALVTSSGSNRVAVVDIAKLIEMLTSASAHEREHVFPNHLGKPTEFVVKHIDVEYGSRGITITPDGKIAFVANALDDSVSVIDLDKLETVGRIDLGGPKVITKVRYGERLFHGADITFHRQFSCHSCHPDGHVDGLTYDIEPDGIGVSPVDNRTLRGILDTAPFKWEGTNPSLQRQCGPRLAVFFTRIQPFTPEELSALDNYICTIPRPPNRYRPLGAELTEAQRRGKIVFERTMANDGQMIPKENRCVTCHCPPLYTDRQRHDIGTKLQFDRESHFDTPHLNNIYDSAPYLHNGIAETLEEIWTRYNPHDQHGVTNDMTKDQLNDLIEYIKTL
ncbi:MAG: beta-propeller fold lactonase family protein [Sedimentisphaerales bacterium]|nr:beta-propeller fold lactonase family protein [Sedimentisphaerales bacterium]